MKELESKFIKGTNEQYSIREDGVVIRNYRRNKHNNIKNYIYNELKGCKVNGNIVFALRTIDKKVISRSKNSLIYEYFPEIKKLNKLNATKKVRERANIIQNNKYKMSKNIIDKAYVAKQLDISIKNITKEIYKTYKESLLFKRKLAKEYNMSIHSFK